MSGRGRFAYGELLLGLYPTSLRSRVPHMHMRIAIIPMTHVCVIGETVERHCRSWLVTEFGEAEMWWRRGNCYEAE